MSDYISIQTSSTVPTFGCLLSDQQILAALLEPIDLARAEFILEAAGSLQNLATMGPLETRAMGLTEEELNRVEHQIEFVSRILARAKRPGTGRSA